MKENQNIESVRYYSKMLNTVVGDLLLVADPSALVGLYFVGGKHALEESKDWHADESHPVLRRAQAELAEYFRGERKAFSMPLRFAGTDFQQKVWREIAGIPFGETITYGELAERAGNPAAVRAAGTSTGRNPIAIIVPCHRVMGKDGSLTGFAGGLTRKARLLEIENPHLKLSW